MPEIIEKKDWSSHPFLSKLTMRSDYDGDAAYTIENPSDQDFEEAKKVVLERSVNDGPWEAAPFADSAPFINEMAPAWYFSFMYHPGFEFVPDLKGKQIHKWRAIINQ
jgi:hypothetical protein